MTLQEEFERDTGYIEPNPVLYKDTKYYQELANYLDERVEWLEDRLSTIAQQLPEGSPKLKLCEECGEYPADLPSNLCCGCNEYKSHF